MLRLGPHVGRPGVLGRLCERGPAVADAGRQGGARRGFIGGQQRRHWLAVAGHGQPLAAFHAVQ